MKLKSLRNGKTANVIEKGSKEIAWKLEFEDGTITQINEATIKRWWREELDMSKKEPAEPVIAPPPKNVAEPVKAKKEAKVKAPKAEPAKEMSSKQKRKAHVDISEMIIKNKLEEIALARGLEIVDFNVHGCRSIKHLGHHCLPFTYSSFGVILWFHSKAIQGLTEYRKVNHLFDARVNISKMDPETEVLMNKLVDAAMKNLEARWSKKENK